VDERVEHVSRRRSIHVLLDSDRDGTGHDEHEKRGDAEIKRLPWSPHGDRSETQPSLE
jgi:hypothetical protein